MTRATGADSPNNFTDIIPAILCGGAGARLWPLSRSSWPKQLTTLFGDHSLLQDTIGRSTAIAAGGAPLVICNVAHRQAVERQLADCEVPGARLVLEPVGRNTAPAAAACALEAQALAGKPDPVILLLPADHRMATPQAFAAAVDRAVASARAGNIVTFGIVPHYPETGYGYINASQHGAEPPWALTRFVEKPDLETAQGYLRSGDYFWNSGMFATRADVLLAELQRARPDIHDAVVSAWQASALDGQARLLDPAGFAAVPAEAIDFAVMESTRRGTVVPLDVGWSDIGSWNAVWEESPRDGFGNAARGDVLMVDSHDIYVHGDGQRLVTTVGVTDLVIVDTSDALLIADRNQSQRVREVVDELSARQRPEVHHHQHQSTAFGWQRVLDHGVLRLGLEPAGRYHQADAALHHWVTVAGSASIDGHPCPAGTAHSTTGPVLVEAGDTGAELIVCAL